jgi:CheY-like chemotaxis protein
MQLDHRPLTVLLAEDAPANQTLVVRLLERRGHRVLVASNGREAVSLFESAPIDLILMDLQMPVMDGFEATQAIRKLHIAGQRPVPIVALSVHNSRPDRERCLLAGMDACIAKPIDVNQLIELVETLASKQPAQSRSPSPTAAAVNCEAAIARLDGDRDLFLELFQLFQRDAPRLLSRIAAGVAAGEAREVALAAHTLKGLAANFDAHRAMEAAGELEAIGNGERLKGAAAVLKRLKHEINEAQQAIARYRERSSVDLADQRH